MFTIQKIGRYFIGVGMYVLIFQFKFIGTNQTGLFFLKVWHAFTAYSLHKHDISNDFPWKSIIVTPGWYAFCVWISFIFRNICITYFWNKNMSFFLVFFFIFCNFIIPKWERNGPSKFSFPLQSVSYLVHDAVNRDRWCLQSQTSVIHFTRKTIK